MTIEELLKGNIHYVAHFKDKYFVMLEQTDHGDDGVYWVDSNNRTVTYDSYTRLICEDWFDEDELKQISLEQFNSEISKVLRRAS